MKRCSFKRDSAGLEALRRETLRSHRWARVMQVVTVVACLFTLNLLAQWHLPEQRTAVIDAITQWLNTQLPNLP